MVAVAERPICKAFAVIAELAHRLGVRNISEMAGCWEHQIDDDWWIALNSHAVETASSQCDGVPAWHVYISWGGSPVGLISPYGGCLIGRAEDDFIAAVERARDLLPVNPTTR